MPSETAARVSPRLSAVVAESVGPVELYPDETVLRVWAHSHALLFTFVTSQHRHGQVNRATGEVLWYGWDEPLAHGDTCLEMFPCEPREGWRRDVLAIEQAQHVNLVHAVSGVRCMRPGCTEP